MNFAPAEDSSPALPCSWPGEGCTARLILTREGPDRLLRGPGSPQTGSTVFSPLFSEESRLPRRWEVAIGRSEWNSQGPWKGAGACGPPTTSQSRTGAALLSHPSQVMLSDL